MQENLALKCTECNRKTYTTSKNPKQHTAKMEMSKHCKFCKKHTLHKETKIK
ncbi:MAG: 50S ribosomal protein L33 [Candidatus Omnitrophica bacterium]|nr:50S ribosomal protein L33 [Candidatus Omnitrophota bacterium]